MCWAGGVESKYNKDLEEIKRTRRDCYLQFYGNNFESQQELDGFLDKGNWAFFEETKLT